MEPWSELSEAGFSLPPVLRENLSKLGTLCSSLAEQRLCELAFCADAAAGFCVDLYRDGMSFADALALLPASLLPTVSPHAEALEQNAHRLCRYADALSLTERLAFCELLLSALAARGQEVGEGDFLPELPTGESIVYVRSPLADEAYDLFCERFSDPRVSYVTTPAEAVRAVEEQRAGYCILPLEERGGVRLSSVMQLMLRADLHIAALTPVYGFLGDADMKYALLCRSFSIPALTAEDDRYLELRLPSERGALSHVLLCAEQLGMAVYRMSLSPEQTDTEGSDTLVLRADGQAFTPLLLLLTLFYPAYGAVGLYSNLQM